MAQFLQFGDAGPQRFSRTRLARTLPLVGVGLSTFTLGVLVLLAGVLYAWREVEAFEKRKGRQVTDWEKFKMGFQHIWLLPVLSMPSGLL